MPEHNLLKTPIYRYHLQLGARMVPFAGYEMPVQYSGVLQESEAVRTAAGLFDVSHMGQVVLRGKNALAECQRFVSNDLSRIALGQAQYNMLCNDEGGVIDDLIVYRRKEDEVFICVNASNREADVTWFKSRLSSGVEFEDLSDQLALLAIQGPRAEAILKLGTDSRTLDNLLYYWAVDADVFGEKVYLSRTGYTGEDGFELYIDAKRAGGLWEILLEKGRAHGLLPAGLGARDALRIEMGYPLHGSELSPRMTPFEANLGWVVKLNTGKPFFGHDALVKVQESGGPSRTLKGFRLQDRRIPRAGYPLTDGKGNKLGVITSGTFSTSLNGPVALGFVDKTATGMIYVQIRDAEVPTEITPLPFVKPKTKKK